DPALATGDQNVVIQATSTSQAVLADGVNTPTVLADLTISGADAAPGAGAGTTALVVHNSTNALTIARSTIVAGDSGSGASGSNAGNAANANATPSMTGGSGGDGNEFDAVCDNTSRGFGGTAGVNTTTPSLTNGGVGGAGGTMDTLCPLPFSYDPSARPG